VWQAIFPWIAGGGLPGLAWIVYRLHKDAVTATQKGAEQAIAAERQRADDWRAAAEAAAKRADVREQQLATLLRAAREPA
jgi:hypothetical protein